MSERRRLSNVEGQAAITLATVAATLGPENWSEHSLKSAIQAASDLLDLTDGLVAGEWHLKE